MDSLKRHLIEKARTRFGEIFPVAHRSYITDCFVICDDRMELWFNDRNNSTHVVHEPLNPAPAAQAAPTN